MSRRAGAAPAPPPRRAGHPQHLRHRHGAAEQPAADVFPPCQPPLPQRALSARRPWPWPPGRSWSARMRRAFYAPSAEELAFNSQGACRTCGGTGTVRTGDRATLVPDESLTIDEGAVAPWNSDVVADDRCLPRHGGAHRRAVPRPDRCGERDRL